MRFNSSHPPSPCRTLRLGPLLHLRRGDRTAPKHKYYKVHSGDTGNIGLAVLLVMSGKKMATGIQLVHPQAGSLVSLEN